MGDLQIEVDPGRRHSGGLRADDPKTVLFLKSTALFLMPSLLAIGLGVFALVESDFGRGWKIFAALVLMAGAFFVGHTGLHIWRKGDLERRFSNLEPAAPVANEPEAGSPRTASN